MIIKDAISRRISSTEIASKTSLHPFVIQKISRPVEKFSLDELKSKYQALLELDTKTKMGILNLTDSLYTFLIS